MPKRKRKKHKRIKHKKSKHAPPIPPELQLNDDGSIDIDLTKLVSKYCPHVDQIKNKVKTFNSITCGKCTNEKSTYENSTDLVLCLSCFELNCSRYSNKHGLNHWNETNQTHNLCMMIPISENYLITYQKYPTYNEEQHSSEMFSIWCYKCNVYLDYTDQDNTPKIKKIRSEVYSCLARACKRIRQKRFPTYPNEVIDNRYSVGDWLVVVTDTHQWVRATVIDKKNNWIIVEFEGWSSKYDKLHVIKHKKRLLGSSNDANKEKDELKEIQNANNITNAKSKDEEMKIVLNETKEELQEKEINKLNENLKRFESMYESLQDRCDTLQRTNKQMQDNKRKKEMENCKKYQQLENKLTKQKSKKNKLKQNYEKQIQSLTEKYDNSEKIRKELDDKWKSKWKEKQSENNKLNVLCKDLETSLHESVNNHIELKQKYDNITAQNKVTQLKMKQLQNEYNILKRTNKQMKDTFDNDRQHLEHSLQKLINKHKELKQEYDNNLTQTQRKYNNIIAQNKVTQIKMEQLQNAYNKLELKYNKENEKFSYLKWNATEIANWILNLNKIKYKKYENILVKNMRNECIDGQCLHELDKNDLHRLGIAHYKDKGDILNAIQQLIRNNKTQKQVPSMDERKDSKSAECVICCEDIPMYICIPCGHLNVCGNCKNKLTGICPICQEKYESVVRVYHDFC